MLDPRDEIKHDANEVLTEDSDDELADLEKEFEAKKQKLLEERARKRQRTRTVEVERSPSPPRKRQEPKIYKELPKVADIPVNTASVHKQGGIRKVSRPSQISQFASKFHEAEEEVKTIDYTERVFEFQNLPLMKTYETTEEDCKDAISGEILSRRYYQESVLLKSFQNFKILRISKLLAKVVPPTYEEPPYVNWCFCGIVMHKSLPKTTVNKSKYMALRVGNFQHTIDVMLFNDAFQKFWKVRAGDVIAILNPRVKKYGTGFSLSITDDLDNFLELGTLKHYGKCAAKTQQGEPCKHVVDTLKNKLCSYHEESKYKQGARMELQGSVKPKAPVNKKGDASEMYMNGSKPLYVQYANAGFHEKDLVFSGGEQFDHTKYDRAVESKQSKLRKQRANARLEEQLLQNVAPRHLNELTKLGIVKEKRNLQKETELALEVRKHAFNSSFITGMGFDPTVASDLTKRKANVKLEQLKQLRELSQAKKISLEPSKEEVQEKQQKWKNAFRLTKPGTQPIKPTQLKLKSTKSPIVNVLDSEESDIEITFTGDLEKMQYYKQKERAHNGK